MNPPSRLIEEIGAAAGDCETGLMASEIRCCVMMQDFPEGECAPGEVACVGAGLGGGFENASELHVMKHKKAMATEDRPKWEVAVEEEHQRMVDAVAWKAIMIKDLPRGAKIVTSTWAMKKKSSGVFRARINARGFEQVDGLHCKEDDEAGPVVNDATFHILLILMLMAEWSAHVLDVKGAFLDGLFEDGEAICMKVPEGFERRCPSDMALLLLRALCGLKQSACAFWK